MPGRKNSTCKSLGSALCENCRSTRKLKCLNSRAAAAACTAASRRELRCDAEVAKALTLAQPEHPAARNQRRFDKRMGGGQHAGAKHVAQSSAHRQLTALLHASRQRADELRASLKSACGGGCGVTATNSARALALFEKLASSSGDAAAEEEEEEEEEEEDLLPERSVRNHVNQLVLCLGRAGFLGSTESKSPCLTSSWGKTVFNLAAETFKAPYNAQYVGF